MNKDTSSPFRSIESYYKLKTTPEEGIDTLVDAFEVSILRHKDLPALGTREVLSEEEEVTNNKIFKKVGGGGRVLGVWFCGNHRGMFFQQLTLGNYSWQTYNEVEKRVMNIQAALLKISDIDTLSQVLSYFVIY